PVSRLCSGIAAGKLGRNPREVGLVVKNDLADLANAVIEGERLHEIEPNDVLDRSDAVRDRKDGSHLEPVIDVDLIAAKRGSNNHPQRLGEILAAHDRCEVQPLLAVLVRLAEHKHEVAIDELDARPENTPRNDIVHAVTNVWGSLIARPGW